uniref:NB-ARC domain-containing protein n=1 Tax=Leersia perrieri TaxID=77586 RepID=A0A0D9V9R1_9ORYZ
MAETAITTVLAKVGELVAWEAATLLDVGDEVRLLRDKLEWLHTFIRDADRRRRRRDDEFVAVWVRQTRDVAFEAEDALDHFLHRAARRHRRKNPSFSSPSSSCWLGGFAGEVALRHDLSGRIRQIKKRLDQISDIRADYNIDHTPSPAWAAPSCSSSFPAASLAAWDDLEEYTVGFDKYSGILKEQLLDAAAFSGRRALVSIVGESSVGKTTLARKVYQSPEVRNHFAIRTWTVLPPNTRPADLLRDINRQATAQLRAAGDATAAAMPCRSPPGGDTSNVLFKNMSGRRYLLVVDGGIAAADWNSLRASLPDEGNGSRVLLITGTAGLEVIAYAGVGSPATTYEPITLTRLSPENTYEVFRRRVFGRRGDIPGRYKSRYYQDVFRITRGLPLSIVILAGVLRSRDIPSEWDDVMSQLTAVPTTPTSPAMMRNDRRIMSLAFDDLPHHLKSCFLYLAATTKESATVDAQRMIRLWIAEGFVRPRRGSTMEEVGQGYLDELIARWLVQPVEKDEFNVVQFVVVHDRLHAFAQDEAQEASFVDCHDGTDVLAPATVRRLAVQNSSNRHVHLGNAFPKLRSIICDLVDDRNGNGGGTAAARCIQSTDLGFLLASKFLRVIDIHGIELKKLPNEIASMVHIRYLGLQCGQLEKLPASICNLINLQSLILKGINAGNRLLDVAAAFWRIPTLRHVVAPLALPKLLGDLHSLQTLHGVQPLFWDTRCSGNPLGKSTNLRSLELTGVVAKHAAALTSALESLDLLIHLNLRGESLPSAVFTIPSLRRLQSLKLIGSMDSPDGPIGDGSDDNGGTVRYIRPNLTRLSMWETMVGQKFVDMLGELPSLAELAMMPCSYDGDRLEFRDGGFRGLQKLKLGLPGLEEWTVRAGAMATLARLTLYGCVKMRMLPEAIAGIGELEEVVLFRMPRMVERIKKHGGEDHHKVRHVPVIQTIW